PVEQGIRAGRDVFRLSFGRNVGCPGDETLIPNTVITLAQRNDDCRTGWLQALLEMGYEPGRRLAETRHDDTIWSRAPDEFDRLGRRTDSDRKSPVSKHVA